MTILVFHSDPNQLPRGASSTIPVQLYGTDGRDHEKVSVIGRPMVDRIKRLGTRITPQAIDFLSISLAITAADTFVKRENSADGWTREMTIRLPLFHPRPWIRLREKLEIALHFLSGDIWKFEFKKGGYAPPEPYPHRNNFRLLDMTGLDCVSLFSGGLDSAIGAIDLLSEGRAPLLVSHAYPKDKAYQDTIESALHGRHGRFYANADPHLAAGSTDVSMRTRSVNFLALGAVGASALQANDQGKKIELFVPENGFISLNVPLTSRRIGSLSTRTTHPYFIGLIQEIFDEVGIRCDIRNPYQFKTKGEMVSECKAPRQLRDIVEQTVSCSHWKRKNQQCGCCVPCIIRRSSLFAGGIGADSSYRFENIHEVSANPDRRDDLIALCVAIDQIDKRDLGAWVLDSGPLPPDRNREFQDVFCRGLKEVEAFFVSKGLL